MKNARDNSGYFVSGIVIALCGAICFSTKAIFVKLAYRETTIDAVSLLALRMIFALPFFLVSAWFTSNKSTNVKFTFKEWMWVALIGCTGYYISSLLDFLGLQYVSASIERLVLFIYPTLVLLISSVIFKLKIKKIQWLAVSLSYVGLMLAFISEARINEGPNSNFYLGVGLVLGCAITYAFYIIGSGKIIPKVGAAKFNSYAMSFAAVGVIIHFWLTNENSLLNFESTVYLYSVAMAVLSTVIPSFLVTEGIRRIGADNAAIVGSIGPVSTILQAYIFLAEPITVAQLTGTVLVIIGILLIGRSRA